MLPGYENWKCGLMGLAYPSDYKGRKSIRVVFTRRRHIDELGIFHANQTFFCVKILQVILWKFPPPPQKKRISIFK